MSHPHIIELIEVFDFFNEKYLVTELVPGKSKVVLDDVLKRKNLRLAQSSQDLKTSFCCWRLILSSLTRCPPRMGRLVWLCVSGWGSLTYATIAVPCFCASGQPPKPELGVVPGNP